MTSRLILGTVQFGLNYGIANQSGIVTRSVAKSMLKLAAANGVNTLDTAIAYGDSEACLGKIGIQNFNVVTKLPAVPGGCMDVSSWVQEQIAASLNRLNMTAVYGLLLHYPQQLLAPSGKELYQSLQELKRIGKVQKVGISIYAPVELDMLIPRYQFDLVQAPFNLVDRRLYISGWLRLLKHNGIEIHTRSAFLQGLLLMSQASRPQKFAPWTNLWDKWHNWLAVHGISAVQACLTFAFSFPEIDRVIVGVDSINQLEQVITATRSVVPNDFPDLHCDSENLINPGHWCYL